jgi:hypothetical protein
LPPRGSERYRQRRVARDDITQGSLSFVESPHDAWQTLRDTLSSAAVCYAQSFEDVGISKPLVQALVRAQHHPLAPPIPEYELHGGVGGPDAAPHRNALVAASPELRWDLDAMQDLIIRATLEEGDHELDDLNYLVEGSSWAPLALPMLTG